MSANEECRGGARRLRRSRLPLVLALCTLVAASAGSVRAQDEPPVEPPPEFDLGDLPDFFDADPIAEEPRLTIHGTIDLTLILFDSEENLDGFPEDRLTLLEPRISLAYDWTDRTRLLAEIEVDGLDWELEVEQLNLRHSLDDHLDVTAGVFYVPFGIERHYYAPATNPLVDRPSPFRADMRTTRSGRAAFGRGDAVTALVGFFDKIHSLFGCLKSRHQHPVSPWASKRNTSSSISTAAIWLKPPRR